MRAEAVPQSARFTGRCTGSRDTAAGKLYRRLYVHPARFLDDLQRTGITNWHEQVRAFVRSFSRRQLLLDLGCGNRRIGDNVVAMDIAANAATNVVGDGHRLPFSAGSFDGVVLQMVLEHVESPETVVAEAYRVLKPGGRLFCEVPFLYPVHDRSDYRRWNLAGLKMLCGEFDIISQGASMGPYSAISALLRQTIRLYFSSVYLEAAADLLCDWILWPFKLLDRLAPRPNDLAITAAAVYVVARKEA